MKKSFSIAFLLFLILASALTVRIWQANRLLNPVEMFDRVKIGMTRTAVDRLLGRPTFPALREDSLVWYLPSPAIERHQSPYAFGAIGIRFDGDRVSEKELNPQCKKRRITGR